VGFQENTVDNTSFLPFKFKVIIVFYLTDTAHSPDNALSY